MADESVKSKVATGGAGPRAQAGPSAFWALLLQLLLGQLSLGVRRRQQPAAMADEAEAEARHSSPWDGHTHALTRSLTGGRAAGRDWPFFENNR